MLGRFQRARRNITSRLTPYRAVLGDENDNVYAGDGMYWVRPYNGPNANDFATPGAASRVRSGSALVVPRAGFVVWVGWGFDKRLTVLGYDHDDLVRKGINPSSTQPNDPYRQWIRLKDIQNFRALPVATANTPSLKVQVRQLFYYTETGDLVRWNGTNESTHIDLSAYVPANGLQRYVVLWLRTYNPNGESTIQITYSDTISSTDAALSFDQLQECANAADADTIPIQAFRLANAQTTLKIDDTIDVDLRQFINMPQVYGFPNTVTRAYRVHEGFSVVAPSAITIEDGGVVQVQDNALLLILAADESESSISGGGGSMSFDITGDTGDTETVSNGTTLSLVGAGGISVDVDSATDTITIDGSNVTDVTITSSDDTLTVAESPDNTFDIYITEGGITIPLFNTTFLHVTTSDPTVNDDSGDGYQIGSRWENSSTKKEFVLLDATPGAAVWKETTLTGTVTSVSGTSPISSSGGATPAISLNDTAVTPGTYTYAGFTVDQKGRLTAASSGTNPVTSVSASSPLSSSGGTTPTISHNDTAVTPGTYTYATVTVDQKGHVTGASSGAAPTGTVTSVALSLPSIFSVSGSPVTTSGTLAGTLATQTANTIFAGPSSGGAVTPAFRALVTADIPWPTPGTIGSTTPNTGEFTDARFGPAGASLSAARVVINGAASSKSLIVRSNATTPGLALEFQNSSGTTTLSVDAAATSPVLFTAAGVTRWTTTDPAINVFVIRGAASHTGNHFVVANDGGTRSYMNIDSVGQTIVNTHDTTTSAVKDTLLIRHSVTSGTPATGYGAGLAFYLQSSTTDNQNAGVISAIWTTATHASRVSKFTVSVYNISTKVDAFDVLITGISTALDVTCTVSTKGFVLTDRGTGGLKRIVSTNGVLSTENA